MDQSELARYPGLHLRGSTYYVRKRVPVDLAHIEKREQIRLSLDTSDKKIAIRRYPAKLAEIERTFTVLRAALQSQGHAEGILAAGKLEKLTRREIEALVAAWWEKRAQHRQPPLSAYDDPAEHLASLDDDAAAIRRPDLLADPIGRATDQLLVEAGHRAEPRKLGRGRTQVRFPVVDRASEEYAYLRQLVRRALEQELALARDYVTQREDAPYDPMFNPNGLGAAQEPLRGQQTHTVEDWIEEYRAEREALLGKESTGRKYGLLFRVLREVLGAGTPVRSISRNHCVQVISFLRSLPPNVTKLKRYRGLTLSDAVALAKADGAKGLAANTVGSYMQGLSAMLHWAQNAEWEVRASTRGLVETRRNEVQRRGFTPAELTKLFAALNAFREEQPTKFWVPALATFTGARAGEICQLRSEDVIDVGGVKCLNLSVFDARGERVEEKRLKTAASERILPLHPTLLNAGFLAFVERQGNQDRLFPDLTPGPKGNYSHEFSKWFGRFKRGLGFTERSLVFHSFRHGFKDACSLADIGDETTRALGGWATINQASRYGNRSAVPVLNRAVKKLKFGSFVLPPPT
ncbi:MAG: site-specific integrase [Proteobacteria bacterium]|nr:site-specific integrase [Pseudomonadota bacterium]